jgi:hypothetical protein
VLLLKGDLTMSNEQTIREMVQEYVTAEKIFTSVDIGNAIKTKTLTMDIRNRDVRDWLRTNIGKDPLLADYVSEPIDVNNGHTATVYRPHWKDVSDYIDRDQKALGPGDLVALSPSTAAASASGSPKVASATATVTATRNDNSQLPIQDIVDDGSHDITGTGVKLVRKSRYVRRIQIPGDITQALGWKPGQKVDLDKIKIHTGKLNPNLKVWYDGRVSISRKLVGFGVAPINIILKGDEIYFEKA